MLSPTVHSDIAVQEDSQVHCQVAPLLPTNHPKILCDASVQVTCQHDLTIRRAMVEAAVQVGSSLLFNAQKFVTDQTTDNNSQESNIPVAVPHSGLLRPIRAPEEIQSSSCSLHLLCDKEQNDLQLDPSLEIAVPRSGVLPPVLAPCLQDFPLREEMWSSSSGLRLSCDEEPNDLQLDLDLEMLRQRLPSLDSFENMVTIFQFLYLLDFCLFCPYKIIYFCPCIFI